MRVSSEPLPGDPGGTARSGTRQHPGSHTGTPEHPLIAASSSRSDRGPHQWRARRNDPTQLQDEVDQEDAPRDTDRRKGGLDRGFRVGGRVEQFSRRPAPTLRNEIQDIGPAPIVEQEGTCPGAYQGGKSTATPRTRPPSASASSREAKRGLAPPSGAPTAAPAAYPSPARPAQRRHREQVALVGRSRHDSSMHVASASRVAAGGELEQQHGSRRQD